LTGRRGLVVAVLLCAAGAGLVLLAASRGWAVEVTQRPSPLPELRVSRSGGDLRPWLPALGWVALAGAGALLATRSALRRVVGGLLVLAGAGAAVAAMTVPGVGVGAGWPLLAAAGGLAVVAAGVLTTARGGRAWPAMGARYERATSSATRPGTDGMWDALDRGEDPTDR
jgi:hypothetical protein